MVLAVILQLGELRIDKEVVDVGGEEIPSFRKAFDLSYNLLQEKILNKTILVKAQERKGVYIASNKSG